MKLIRLSRLAVSPHAHTNHDPTNAGLPDKCLSPIFGDKPAAGLSPISAISRIHTHTNHDPTGERRTIPSWPDAFRHPNRTCAISYYTNDARVAILISIRRTTDHPTIRNRYPNRIRLAVVMSDIARDPASRPPTRQTTHRPAIRNRYPRGRHLNRIRLSVVVAIRRRTSRAIGPTYRLSGELWIIRQSGIGTPRPADIPTGYAA